LRNPVGKFVDSIGIPPVLKKGLILSGILPPDPLLHSPFLGILYFSGQSDSQNAMNIYLKNILNGMTPLGKLKIKMGKDFIVSPFLEVK